MKFLLDTNVISDFVRGDAVVQSNLRTSAPADVAVSAITVMEIAYGLARNPRKAQRISPLIDSLLASITILAYVDADAKETGRIRAELDATPHQSPEDAQAPLRQPWAASQVADVRSIGQASSQARSRQPAYRPDTPPWPATSSVFSRTRWAAPTNGTTPTPATITGSPGSSAASPCKASPTG